MSLEPLDILNATLAAILGALGRHEARRPLVAGLCGAQGSGKSTLAARLAKRCEAHRIKTAILSIDDLYKTRAERRRLAREVHPLLLTRGVPGTHDVALGLDLFDKIDRGHPVLIPRFDKALDDRAPQHLWGDAVSDVQVVIFEGWCVGARPQVESALAHPVNALERDEDPHGIWRSFANQALGAVYQPLFARLDLTVLLTAPSFEIVLDWRIQQEQGLRCTSGQNASGIMSDFELCRFIQHYERLTRHILFEMPKRADLVVTLDESRSPLRIVTQQST